MFYFEQSRENYNVPIESTTDSIMKHNTPDYATITERVCHHLLRKLEASAYLDIKCNPDNTSFKIQRELCEIVF